MPNSGPLHVLLLAGTAEAAALDAALADGDGFRVTVALAGVTRNARPFHGAVRRGGFGGAEGLAAFLRDGAVDLVVDATHPFAARMTAHALKAAKACGTPILRLSRPAWTPPDGATWLPAQDLAHAARLLPPDATAFLALGQRHLAAFQGHGARLAVRSIDPPPPDLLPTARWIVGPPGQSVAEEQALLMRLGVTHLVARNSGGTAGWAKIAAAAALSLPVIMIARPAQQVQDTALNVAAALDWLRSMPCSSRGAQPNGTRRPEPR